MDANPYAPPDAQPASSQMICHSCGIMLPPESRICGGCGAAVSSQNIRGQIRENHELRALARAQLRGGWLAAIGIVLVYSILLNSIHIIDIFMGWMIPGYIIQFILGGPLTIGLSGYFLDKARGQQAHFGNLFEGFRLFGKSFLLYFLYVLFCILWGLLFIVPGIIKLFFSYSMSYFILRDNPEMGPLEALRRSRKMMNGYKAKLFFLYSSFLGWILLLLVPVIIAAFLDASLMMLMAVAWIGILWITPYIMQSLANFYEDVKYNA